MPICGVRDVKSLPRHAIARRCGTHYGYADQAFYGHQLIDFVPGGDTVDKKADRIFLLHSQRYDITRELTEIHGAPMTHHS